MSTPIRVSRNTYDTPTQPNETCTHKQATHLHGTHACYVLDRCRCTPCNQANTAYEKYRRGWTSEFPYRDAPYVDADEARKLIMELTDRGMGLKTIAATSGVAHGTLWKLVYGVPGRGPSKRCRPTTIDKLAGVLDDLMWGDVTLADGRKVPGQEARLIIRELVARGWAKAEIGRRVTGNPDAQSLQVMHRHKRGGEVTVRTLRTLRELMCEPVPLRIHNPTGKQYQPNPNYVPKTVPRLVDGVGGPIFRERVPLTDRIIDLLDLEGWMTYEAIADRLQVSEWSVAREVAALGGRLRKRQTGPRTEVALS